MPSRLITGGWMLWLLAAAPAAAAFPAITDAERALTAVPGHPGAPAVVLFKRAELHLADPGGGGTSLLDVMVRIKILTADGRRWGEVAVGHGAGLHLEEFAGRTVGPGGEVVPVPEDAIFVEERSRQRQRFVTKAAFPAVLPGAILDYRFTLRWDSPAFPEPWVFADTIPTRLAEITYYQPPGTTVTHHGRAPADQPFRTVSDQTLVGRRVRVWLEDLPAVPVEPWAVPFEDLASYVLIVPRAIVRGDGRTVPLLDSWSSVCRRFDEDVYGPAHRQRRQTAKRARELTAAAGSRRDRVDALYRFVRDGLQATGEVGVRVGRGMTADRILAAGGGGAAEKALLLRAMLAAVRVPARLVWASDWRQGQVDLTVPNPGWFEKVLVLVDLDGRPVFCDPGDRRLALGRLAPTTEGTRALVFDPERPEVLTLPTSPAAASVRRAVLELTLDAEGRLAGSGTLRLTGHHAWYYLRRLETEEETTRAWAQWLRNHFPGFAIADVRAAESVDREEIDVVWSLGQEDEEVLGDECSLRPSLPLGPTEQRYTIPPERRRTPVRVSFADRDEVELRLAWPPGWEVELVPAPVDHHGALGSAVATTEVDAERYRLRYRRRFEITATVVAPGEPYAALRELYTAMERHDAQNLVLVRRD